MIEVLKMMQSQCYFCFAIAPIKTHARALHAVTHTQTQRESASKLSLSK